MTAAATGSGPVDGVGPGPDGGNGSGRVDRLGRGRGAAVGPGRVDGARPRSVAAVRPRQVAVCGPRECAEVERVAARRVGELLAEAGAVVLCGGGTGVMAAVAEGAGGAGGLVVGIRPGDDLDDAAPGLSAVVATGLGEARNAVLVRSADAVIVVGGSWGTLSELALARRFGVPVVGLLSWTVRDADGRPPPDPVPSAHSPEEAVRAALAACLAPPPEPHPTSAPTQG